MVAASARSTPSLAPPGAMSLPLSPTTSHTVYLFLSFFLLSYALFSSFIRNRLHLSEPPLATAAGVVFSYIDPDGVLGTLPDSTVLELARVVVSIQCFTIGISLPPAYVWRPSSRPCTLALLIGPGMLSAWLVSAVAIRATLSVGWSTALLVAACLTPTDPVLSASVLSEARFSKRVPRRVREILQTESGCNDGGAYPIVYAVIFALIKPTTAEAVTSWVLEVMVWQCAVGILAGALLGGLANRALRFSEARGYVQESTLFAFYILLALLATGVGSTLGLDGFLLNFAAGTAFGWDGWFASRTKEMHLPSIIDLMLNSAMFVYFGVIMPWRSFTDAALGPGRLLACLMLILLFRRLPALLALKPLLPALRTYSEALFAGHFGPMGVGALFLAIEVRARLETGTSEPLPGPPGHGRLQEEIKLVWPVVCFIVLGSVVVHGSSALVMSIYSTLSRRVKHRSAVLGGEEALLGGMEGDTDASGYSSDEET